MERYNGWANYETWRINLEVIDGLTPRDLGVTALVENVEALGQVLEMHTCELIEQQAKGFALDLAHSFLARVDWEEIASHMIDDYAGED